MTKRMPHTPSTSSALCTSGQGMRNASATVSTTETKRKMAKTATWPRAYGTAVSPAAASTPWGGRRVSQRSRLV
jgi:hypothetical protein